MANMIDLPRQMTIQETRDLIAWGKEQNAPPRRQLPVGLLFVDIEAACPATGMLLTDIRRLPPEPEPVITWRTLRDQDPYLTFEALENIYSVHLQTGFCVATLKEFAPVLGLPIELYETEELGRNITEVPLTGRFESINGTVYQTGGKDLNNKYIPYYRR